MWIGSRVNVGGKPAAIVGWWPLGYVVKSGRWLAWAYWWEVSTAAPPLRLATIDGKRITST
ncbi:MAG: hypothetical protein FJX35_12295 [Alphaproteobacteria bacterium]|nr:hypothetical protein [Alphaproteobacteria bacterium]